MLTDADFADDLAPLSDKLRNAEKLLKILETEAASAGLYMNTTKIKFIAVNTKGTIAAQNGCDLEQVNDFNYLGSKIISSENDIQMRIGSAWSALYKLTPIWKSNLDVSIKTEFFRATVKSVLTYSSQAWTLTKSLEKKLNGAYIRMLRATLNVHWSQRVTNKKLYNDLPKITETIRYCRLKFSWHIWRHYEEIGHNMLFWVPTNGKSYRKWPTEKSGNHSLTVIFQRDSTSECESDIYSRYIYIVV